MSIQEQTQEEAVPSLENNTMAHGPVDNDGTCGKDSEIENLETQQTYSMILASNRLDVNHISPPKRLVKLS